MNSKRVFVIAIVFVLLASVFVFADTKQEISTGAAIYYEYPTDILALLSSRSNNQNVIEGELIDIKQTKQVVTPQDANGLKAIMLTILGDYETVTTDYTYQTSSQYLQHSITTERDWSWIMTCALFIVVIWCVFRGVVAILCRK